MKVRVGVGVLRLLQSCSTQGHLLVLHARALVCVHCCVCPMRVCVPCTRLCAISHCHAKVEGIVLDTDSLAFLGAIGERTSLRHAVQVRRQGQAGRQAGRAPPHNKAARHRRMQAGRAVVSWTAGVPPPGVGNHPLFPCDGALPSAAPPLLHLHLHAKHHPHSPALSPAPPNTHTHTPTHPHTPPHAHTPTQLLTPSAVLAKTNGRDAVACGDLEEADGLFHDAKASARLLAEQADKYIS